MTDFHELYKRYADDIYHFALFLCGNSADAEDITAETFARALTAKSAIVTETVKGYLLTIARNLYLESIRKRKRFTDYPSELHDSNINLEYELSDKTELAAVMKYLQTFAEVDRSALLLRTDGLTYNEIANALDISLASAKVKVHRLRLKLAEWRANNEMS